MQIMSGILDKINEPRDLRSLNSDELLTLAEEIRGLIIDTVSKTGGHLAANLGVVELTIALLKTFDPPSDKIVWDVSHQTYTYKILTGRKDSFSTLRQINGISGFLKRSESPYDSFGAGHAGTALSAALGISSAMTLDKTENKAIAVVGDAAAGCGVSLEALNNIPADASRLVVILNDNEMSIDANVGAISRYLGRLLVNPRYNRWKSSVESAAHRLKMDFLRSIYYRIEEALKSLFLRSVVFEELGLRYIGPVDGHDMHALLDAMEIARSSTKPILLHVSTQKGKGYKFSEEHPEKWHGTPAFDVQTGNGYTTVNKKQGFSKVFGDALIKIANDDERVTAITAAMAQGTGLSAFANRFPDRFYDVGIAESHAVVFASGLATQGKVPVFAVYSTFLQRSIDFLIHDVCLQDLPVVLCLDRAGIVGDDGPTHHGVFDISLMRSIPGLVFMQPRDAEHLGDMLLTAIRLGKPAAIRYPRGTCPGEFREGEFCEIEIGKAEVLKKGSAVQIWALGDMLSIAEKAADLLKKKGIMVGIVDPCFIRPLDAELLQKQASDNTIFVTIENGILKGGFGSSVEEFLLERGLRNRVICFGWPDQFIEQGSPDLLMKNHGLTSEAVAEKVMSALD